MKIQFFIKYNDIHVAELEKKIAQRKALSYDEMMDCIIDETTNFFAPFIEFMKAEGHEVDMIVTNIRDLQLSWAKDNNIPFGDNWMYDIPHEQIKQFEPDILYLSSNFEYFGDFLARVKPYCKRIFAWISTRFDKNTLVLDHIDHIITIFKPHFDYFKSIDKSCSLTHAVFDSRVVRSIEKKETIEASFVGGIGPYHKNREACLKLLVKQTPIKLWGYGFKSKHWLKNILKQFQYRWVFTKRYQGEAWGIDMLQILSHSKITFNAHGDKAKGHAVNMRLFEATGVGTLLVTEEAPGIEKFFTPGEEIVTYSSPEDAVKKVKYYLKHEDERKKIAEAGQKKTLENYTFERLTPHYLNLFEEKLKNNEKQFSQFPRS